VNVRLDRRKLLKLGVLGAILAPLALGERVARAAPDAVNSVEEYVIQPMQYLGIEDRIADRLKAPVTVYIINKLDQPLTAQIYGNIWRSTEDSLLVSSQLTVPANSPHGVTLTAETSGWVPYLYLRLQCPTAPTQGYVYAELVKTATRRQVMVNRLAIRDTNPHDPSTDPRYIYIVEW